MKTLINQAIVVDHCATVHVGSLPRTVIGSHLKGLIIVVQTYGIIPCTGIPAEVFTSFPGSVVIVHEVERSIGGKAAHLSKTNVNRTQYTRLIIGIANGKILVGKILSSDRTHILGSNLVSHAAIQVGEQEPCIFIQIVVHRVVKIVRIAGGCVIASVVTRP